MKLAEILVGMVFAILGIGVAVDSFRADNRGGWILNGLVAAVLLTLAYYLLHP